MTPLRILAVVLLVAGAAVHADTTVSPAEAFSTAKGGGQLPAWVDLTDRWRIVPQWPTKAFLCIENRQAAGRWVVAFGFDKLVTWGDTGRIAYDPAGPVQPASAAEIKTCWPDYQPPVMVPVALGEPAYWSITCLGDCGATGQPDFATMNRAVAGTTAKGESCGSAVGMGFYLLPRLQGRGGAIAVTRCAP